MLERDLTSQNGVITKLLPCNWVWTRIPDLPHKHRGSMGFDGVLWNITGGWPVEVKIGWAKMSVKELEMRRKFSEVGIRYIILRYFEEHPNSWVVELDNKVFSGNMDYICFLLLQDYKQRGRKS